MSAVIVLDKNELILLRELVDLRLGWYANGATEFELERRVLLLETIKSKLEEWVINENT